MCYKIKDISKDNFLQLVDCESDFFFSFLFPFSTCYLQFKVVKQNHVTNFQNIPIDDTITYMSVS